jgi:hypothetical protein
MDATPPETGPTDTGTETLPDTLPPIDTAPPVMPTAEGMIAAACLALRCDAADAVRYWRSDWDDYDVERTITFRDEATTSTFDVTDDTGATSTLAFVAGIPVTLHLVAPGDGTATTAHDFTAPAFFRTVAFRDVVTASGAYEAVAFDAILPTFETGVEHRATLRFVPIEAGSYTAWSSTGVTDGDRYTAIVDGSASPDLGTGDAGRGMTLTLDVTPADALTVFQGASLERPPSLDADPRRDASDPIWDGAAVALVGITAMEGLDPMTGESVFTFDWTTRTLTRNVGHILELSNNPTNRFRHDFTAMGMMSDAVVRAGLDPDAEVRAPYFRGTVINPGMTIQLFVVPTLARAYQTYCEIGVVHAENGVPDLTTGHAGAGMHDLITIVP